ncbi:MAG: primosomal protein N' [Desulfatirhabdiaceae bacterium]
MENHFIDVAVALPVYATYTYSVPEHLADMAEPGKRVLAPFGRRRVTGYILKCLSPAVTSSHNIRHILDILDHSPLFPESMIRFYQWISDYYIHPIGEVIQTALPGGLNPQDISLFQITEAGRNRLAQNTLNPSQNDILQFLCQEEKTFRQLVEKTGPDMPTALIHAMERQGYIRKEYRLKPGAVRVKQDVFLKYVSGPVPYDGLSRSHLRIMETLSGLGEISLAAFRKIIPISRKQIDLLTARGYIEVHKKPIYRDPFGDTIERDTRPVLMDEQLAAVSRITEFLGKTYQAFLLNGITGSGKTEVYLRVTRAALENNLPVIVMVPEIALISQIERRFRARFGQQVAILHSGLNAGERYDQWRRILDHQAPVAIGARSVLFAPFEKPGLIIVDEEHDPSFKQDNGLRYHARDMALVRAKLENSVVILGSATPSVQSCYNVSIGKLAEIRMNKRVAERSLPVIDVVNMTTKRHETGIHRLISTELHQAMSETLARQEQILLFLNRRGFASLSICAGCGAILRCENCHISMTLHQADGEYRCHYCGFTAPSSTSCPACGGRKLKNMGMGTEKIEAGIKALFPQARVARMDRDTVSKKGALLQILKNLKNREIDILVGTQMITKGHDFPNITLVGVISADQSLNFPDFRASERTFQLLSQVSGRAGRGERPGRVILQSYAPEHFSVQSAIHQDFDGFYRQELAFRNALKYPPFSRLIQIIVSGRDPEETRRHARELGGGLEKIQKGGFEDIEILGPVEAFLPKLEKRYRYQILLKAVNMKSLHQFIHQTRSSCPQLFQARQVHVAIDVDPVFMM